MRAPSTRAAPNGGARSPRPFHDRTNSAGMLFALTCALLFWALFFGGGDGTDRLAWIGGGALALAAVAAAAVLMGRLPRPALGSLGLAFVTCFAGLVLWQGFSILWSVQPDRSGYYVNRGVVYLAFRRFGTVV